MARFTLARLWRYEFLRCVTDSLRLLKAGNASIKEDN
jgi:hypothetical protein